MEKFQMDSALAAISAESAQPSAMRPPRHGPATGAVAGRVVAIESIPLERGRTVTRRAVKRWRNRVNPWATARRAEVELEEFLARGRTRPTPRHWTKIRPRPQLTFVYWAEHPGICALVFGKTVVDVVTRALWCGDVVHRAADLARDHVSTITEGLQQSLSMKSKSTGDFGWGMAA